MPAEEARETPAAWPGNKAGKQVVALARLPQEGAVVRGGLEANRPEAFWAPAGTLAAQGWEAEASRELAA
jgi:hypothetical protein